MTHPEIFILPVLMFADYYLTIVGAVQREKKYAKHFKMVTYELNPVWRKEVDRKQWFSWKHAGLTILLTLLLGGLIEYGGMPEGLIRGLIVFLVVYFGTVIGRHISNLLIFRYVSRNPDAVSGEVSMSHRFVLFVSMSHMLIVLLPFLLMFVFSQSDAAVAGALAILAFMLVHVGWIQRAKNMTAVKPREF